MAQMLTAKQVAEVKGCSPRYIKKIIQDGKLKAVETVNSKNRKTYLVPLDALDEELQHKYYQLIAESPREEVERPEPERRESCDCMSLPRMNERKLISGSTSPSAGSHIERCRDYIPG